MRKFLALLLLLASPALAVTGTITWSDAMNTRFQRDATKLNTATCVSVGLVAGCTGPQARAAFCAVPGSSSQTPPCVVGGRSSTDIVIYNTVADYLDKYVITLFFFPNLRQSQNTEDRANFVKSQETATQAQKDAACAALGLAANCIP